MTCDIVLLVEDDPDIRDDLAFLIQRKGYRVETAAHGAQALEKLKTIGTPCVIILDLMMPVMDGWEFRAELLKDPTLSKVPVVLLSGVADIQSEAKTLDAVDYLNKPVDFEKLYGVVDTYC